MAHLLTAQSSSFCRGGASAVSCQHLRKSSVPSLPRRGGRGCQDGSKRLFNAGGFAGGSHFGYSKGKQAGRLHAQDVRTSELATSEGEPENNNGNGSNNITEPNKNDDEEKQSLLNLTTAAVGVAAVAALGLGAATTAGGVESLLGLVTGGFSAAFSLIFVSELGDKTFFIAALLAMRRGRTAVFTGAVGALAVMTIISVGIGRIFHAVPPGITQGLPIDDYLAITLLVFFGIKSIMDAANSDPEEGEGELADAEEALEEAGELNGDALQRQEFFATVVKTFGLIFVAEWGDRSMLATIALGAAQSPVGVASGAIVGHAVATIIAIAGGSVLSKYISEKTVGYVGGVLFLLFALLTALGLY